MNSNTNIFILIIVILGLGALAFAYTQQDDQKDSIKLNTGIELDGSMMQQ